MDPEQPFSRVRIVLVDTTHPGNIGAAARAMKNMGLSQLYLVRPTQFPHEKATWRAASATDIVDEAHVVDSLDAAIGDCGLVIGTSARNRRIPWPMLDPCECAEKVIEEARRHPVAIVFGREDRGLKNEELQRCHFHVHIPTSEQYTSLNLAMAVQVIAYEIRRAFLSRAGDEAGESWDVELSTSRDLEYFYEHLEQTLIDIDFHDPDNPRQLMTRIRRLFNRIRPDMMEMNILRGILTSIDQKISAKRKR